eukprot:TRINITY_DN1454_c0_g1_i1.p1 TRINITY_DN1454_c0_g1~~TRINITY_DN1454_c0_g1_i1.p1  ORF type:complete len:886 (+),score=222.57 TRINITY_DN1454_c0_g1_i1:112-2769(+)
MFDSRGKGILTWNELERIYESLGANGFIPHIMQHVNTNKNPSNSDGLSWDELQELFNDNEFERGNDFFYNEFGSYFNLMVIQKAIKYLMTGSITYEELALVRVVYSMFTSQKVQKKDYLANSHMNEEDYENRYSNCLFINDFNNVLRCLRLCGKVIGTHQLRDWVNTFPFMVQGQIQQFEFFDLLAISQNYAEIMKKLFNEKFIDEDTGNTSKYIKLYNGYLDNLKLKNGENMYKTYASDEFYNKFQIIQKYLNYEYSQQLNTVNEENLLRKDNSFRLTQREKLSLQRNKAILHLNQSSANTTVNSSTDNKDSGTKMHERLLSNDNNVNYEKLLFGHITDKDKHILDLVNRTDNYKSEIPTTNRIRMREIEKRNNQKLLVGRNRRRPSSALEARQRLEEERDNKTDKKQAKMIKNHSKIFSIVQRNEIQEAELEKVYKKNSGQSDDDDDDDDIDDDEKKLLNSQTSQANTQRLKNYLKYPIIGKKNKGVKALNLKPNYDKLEGQIRSIEKIHFLRDRIKQKEKIQNVFEIKALLKERHERQNLEAVSRLKGIESEACATARKRVTARKRRERMQAIEDKALKTCRQKSVSDNTKQALHEELLNVTHRAQSLENDLARTQNKITDVLNRLADTPLLLEDEYLTDKNKEVSASHSIVPPLQLNKLQKRNSSGLGNMSGSSSPLANSQYISDEDVFLDSNRDFVITDDYSMNQPSPPSSSPSTILSSTSPIIPPPPMETNVPSRPSNFRRSNSSSNVRSKLSSRPSTSRSSSRSSVRSSSRLKTSRPSSSMIKTSRLSKLPRSISSLSSRPVSEMESYRKSNVSRTSARGDYTAEQNAQILLEELTSKTKRKKTFADNILSTASSIAFDFNNTSYRQQQAQLMGLGVS